jgi:hypothetical protein
MATHEADLRTYYEAAAAQRATMLPPPRRVAERDGFLRLLATEGRSSLVEVGSGAGPDAAAFTTAGVAVTAIDLAFEHTRYSSQAGALAVQGSVLAWPFQADSFEAGWTMSTLMHLADGAIEQALAAVASSLVPGAPVAVGMWGGHDRELLAEFDAEPKRYFRLRTHDHARSLLAAIGHVEHFTTWPDDRSDWVYQFGIVRV